MNAPFSLDNRMTIVLFAGMGGGCDGLEDAGFHVHVAINHDPVAVAVHEKRHPHTRHLRCDVFEADPRKVTNGRGVRALHASPDCTHFSVAKGSKPVSKRRRSLAWVILRWAGTVRPETITMENVQEITTWGPLIAKRDPATGRVLRLDGSVAAKGERVPVEQQWLIPDPAHKGRIWRAWLKHLRGLGYNFEHRVLVCADYGVPTIRKRFFGVAQADGRAIVWPVRTHAPRKDAKRLGLKPWVGAHTIIDWSLPVKSIFGRKKPLAEATLRRTARGVMRYVVDAAKPFIVPITHTKGSNAARTVDDPLCTITTAKGGENMVAVPALIRTDQQSAASRNGVHSVEEPVNTLHTSSGMALMGATIVGAGGRAAQSSPRDLAEPLGTTTGKEDRVLVAAHMTKFNQNGDGTMPTEPLDTVMAGAPRHAVVAASLIQSGYGEREGQAPRVLDIEEPARTQVGGSKAALVAAFLAQHNTGEPGRSAEDPVSTIVTLGSTQGVAAVSLQRQFGQSVGADIEDPAPTVTVGGSGKSALVAATLGSMYGSNVAGRSVEEPLATLSTGGGKGGSHAHLILGFLQHYFGSGKQDDDVCQPLGALTGKARNGLVEVMVKGVPHYIDDIGIRMLEPEEGAAAHGFKRDAMPDEITIDGKTRRLTKTEKYHLVGNSVPPLMIELLAECNVRRELVLEAAE
ncbi:DNA cytosine methyltransferase [Mesorhizobium sp. B1-1-2]|uniref:DNA cytosine methyltransferase n=1 Tax=Mesorhizobium sp. B1-1-2 TaxID=2589982 RepID=UPI00112A099D|nr:DNA cytosine methyltransferase [Mesorhizobium sp. B1-1-2]TPN79977.1 DNA cytosine methyltransferase [Mesorhizobium sp. B1-1-2]